MRDALIRQELGQAILAEEIFYEFGIETRHVMKLTLAIEQTLAYDSMSIGIPLQKVASGVHGKDGATCCARCAVPGKASFMTCLTASKAHLGISFKSRLSRSKIPRIALGIEKVQKRWRGP